jgi:hypothetical protein
MKASLRKIEDGSFMLDLTPMGDEGDENIQKLVDFMRENMIGMIYSEGAISGTHSFRIEKKRF